MDEVPAEEATKPLWESVTTTGASRPLPRYEHAGAVVRKKLYIVGGNSGACLAPASFNSSRNVSGCSISLSTRCSEAFRARTSWGEVNSGLAGEEADVVGLGFESWEWRDGGCAGW